MSTQPNTPDQTPEQSDGGYEDKVIKGHKYDGIKEYDNPMPGWWIWTFWATFIFALFYIPAVHFFDVIDTYEEDLAEGVAQLTAVREAYAEATPTFEADEATIAGFIGEDAAIEAGAATYASVCAACHGDQGQGLIGPNLVDAYWIHGGSNVDLFNVITVGVPAKGMPPWEATLTPEQRAEVIAFIRSLEGTEPPNAKEPQGELYEPAS